MARKFKSGRGGARPGSGRPRKNQPISKESNDDKVDKSLPSDRIIDIINICKSSNIKNFKYGTLEITFSEDTTPKKSMTAAETEPVKKMFEGLDSEEAEDLRLSQLMIDDPVAFEQEIIDSHTRRYNAEVNH